jgi:hypothetical protein
MIKKPKAVQEYLIARAVAKRARKAKGAQQGKNSPPKHKTPNYKHVVVGIRLFKDRNSERVYAWKPQPLRAGRKDAFENLSHNTST